MTTRQTKTLFTTMLTAILLMPFTSFAGLGTAGGGGGGGIRVGNRILTLSEAGLVISPESQKKLFYLDNETIKVSQDLMSTLTAQLGPFKNLLRGFESDTIGLFGLNRNYVRLDVVDATLYRKLKSQYAAFVQQTPTKGTFVLPAYTDGLTTYLFPEFFEAEPATRALYLMHEQMFAIFPGRDLKDVLAFEGLVKELRDFGYSPERVLRFGRIMRSADINYLDGLYVWFLTQKNITIHLSDLSVGENVLSLTTTATGVERDGRFTDSLKSCSSFVSGKYTNTIQYLFAQTHPMLTSRGESRIDPEFDHVFRNRAILADSPYYEIIAKGFSSEKKTISGSIRGLTGFGCFLKNQNIDNFKLTVEFVGGEPNLYLTAIDTTQKSLSIPISRDEVSLNFYDSAEYKEVSWQPYAGDIGSDQRKRTFSTRIHLVPTR